MGSPVASVEIQARSHGLSAQLREVRAQFGTFADGVAKTFLDKLDAKKAAKKGGSSFLGGAASTAVGQIGAGASSRVEGFLEDAGKAAFDFNDKLTRLQILANATPESMASFGMSIRKVSDETGIGKDKILDAASAYVALTGNVDVAQRSTAVWAKVAQATNSSVSDIAQTAAAMSQNLKIGPEQMEAVFSSLSIQGKAGAIELKDLASQMSSIAPVWAQFGKGTGVQGVRELGSALQIVKRGFGGDAAETVTGLQSFLTAVTKEAGRFKEGGVGSFFNVKKDGTRELKNVYEIVDLIGKSSLAKDPEKLTKAFGRVEAYRAFIQLKQNREELQKMADESNDAGAIQRDLATYMDSTAGKAVQTWEQLKNKVAEAFTPDRIQRFFDVVSSLAEKAGTLAGFIGKIGDGLGKLEGVGESVRGFISGNSARHYDMADLALSQGNGYQWGGNNSDEAKAARVAGAKSRIADVDIFNKTADTILGAEVDGKVSPASIKAAMDAKHAKGVPAEQQAGEIYLRKAGVKDPEDEAAAAKTAEWEKEQARKTLDQLRQITALLAEGTGIKIGEDTVAKAAKGAPAHRRAVKQ